MFITFSLSMFSVLPAGQTFSSKIVIWCDVCACSCERNNAINTRYF